VYLNEVAHGSFHMNLWNKEEEMLKNFPKTLLESDHVDNLEWDMD
jgi:hypothetical protein